MRSIRKLEKKLILDLRGNAGGFPQIVLAIAELLALKEEHTYIYDGIWDKTTNNYAVPNTGIIKQENAVRALFDEQKDYIMEYIVEQGK